MSYEPFIELTTADDESLKFHVRADAISGMYRTRANGAEYTMLHYVAQQGGHWAVKETPEQIKALIAREYRWR